MKHAYLILAHNNFDLTIELIHALDDSRNDIYIHIDQKTSNIPNFRVKHSNMYFIQDRVSVFWGDVSVVEAEYRLFEAASNNMRYSYYHLLSGVDMPLKSQDEIHDFFYNNNGKEFIGFSNYDYSKEVDKKVKYIHLFPNSFRASSSILYFLKRILRFLFLQFQIRLCLKRNTEIEFKKGTQWVSVTNEFVNELLIHKEQVLKKYKYTFCSDEIYKQTICWNTKFRNNIFDYEDESNGSQRVIGWKDGVLYDWTRKDIEELINSDKLFARKFNTENIDVVLDIKKYIGY